MASRGDVFIGISGWRYAPWRGVFYPKGLPQREELAFASRQVTSIEINGSFYSLQRPSSYQRWHDETPEGFVFAVKGPKYLTHVQRLKDARRPLANFLASGVLLLRAKLGPLLWQLPPYLPYDAERCEAFLSLLPHDTEAARTLAREHDERIADTAGVEAAAGERALPLRHAMEVRHPSFVTPDFIAQLRRHRVALVVADTAGRWPLLEDLSTDFVYLRLHGDEELYASGYSDAALERWAARIAAWRAGRQVADPRLASTQSAPRRRARDVFCYFDNDVKVHAPYDAAKLAALLKLPFGLHAGGRPEVPPDLPPPRGRAPGFRTAARRAGAARSSA
jgi:uncharacterized protein YecE (DUF72 family)